MTFLDRLNRTAKRTAMAALLARHRAMVAGDIAEAIQDSAPGHLHERDCEPGACTTCARRRQALADADLARRIGERP